MIAPYDISPGVGVGIFQLGDSLWHVLDLLRTLRNEYPKLDISWDSSEPHKSAVVIHLSSITLYFPSPSQLLELISFPSLPTSNLTLIYQTQVLASPSQPLTRARVGRILGPTFANEGRGLVYPGVRFETVASASGSGRDALVQKLDVQKKEDESLVLQGQLASCVIQPNKGVSLSISGDSIPLDINIYQTTAQDLLLDLGPPLRKYWKEDDRLEKMWGGKSQPGACFWNYFQYGLDILISPDNVVSKIICYSNIASTPLIHETSKLMRPRQPSTPLFQRYARCPWILSTPSGNLDLVSPVSSFRSLLSPIPSRFSDEDKINSETTDSKKSSSGTEVNGNAGNASNGVKASPMKEMPVMVLDRVVECGLEGVQNVGESRLIGFQGLIIEEDQKSGGICSVLVWKDETS